MAQNAEATDACSETFSVQDATACGLKSRAITLKHFCDSAWPSAEGGKNIPDNRLRFGLEKNERWILDAIRLIRNEVHTARNWNSLEVATIEQLLVGGYLLLVDRTKEHFSLTSYDRLQEYCKAICSDILSEFIVPRGEFERHPIFLREDDYEVPESEQEDEVDETFVEDPIEESPLLRETNSEGDNLEESLIEGAGLINIQDDLLILGGVGTGKSWLCELIITTVIEDRKGVLGTSLRQNLAALNL